ncbi:hypothetical protein G7054_g1638 [Neopestalotiopsis clavispora]|nr:hypothetical protein G7054_g1638 [Neopestalotiopsis clavispora]
MSTAPVAYVDHYGENIEPLWHYCPGGYHPINIGDHLQSRYRIVDKLGHGSYSTIWLARDEQLAKYVAIKVGVARSDHKEVDVLTQLTAYGCQNGHHAEAFILPVLDRFDINGPNGVHPCFVTVPTRCSLRDSLLARNGFLFQTKTARSLTAQLALAVAHIHELGYVHGDLHMGNILLRLPSSLDHLSDEQLCDEFHAPEPLPVSRVDKKPLSLGVPRHVFSPMWLGESGAKLSPAEAQILLADFGTAFDPAQEQRFESYTPLIIQPPESRFDPKTPLSFKSDIWSLACTMLEYRRERGMETFGDEERKDLFEMLKWMLSFRPEERPTAKQVLETAWMRKWAIPEFQRTRTLSTFKSPPLQKEDLLDLIKLHYLPYTIIDLGWWYQLSLPELPSGRIQIQAQISNTDIIGDGNTPMALIDNRDIGKFVARIITDPSTKNKKVFCYGEVMCQNQIFDTLEKVSGESIARHQLSAEHLSEQIQEGLAKLAQNPVDPQSMMVVGMGQYRQLLGIRGDSTPEKAKYLNYLDARDLYPDVRVTPLRQYIEDALAGKVAAPRKRG